MRSFQVGSYWRKHTESAICLECFYVRHGLSLKRAHRVAVHHEKFHPGHNVSIPNVDRGPVIKTYGYIS